MAKVKNGFVPRVRDEIFPALKALQTTNCPFKNLPENGLTMGRDHNRGKDVGMPMGQAQVGLPGRVCGVDGH